VAPLRTRRSLAASKPPDRAIDHVLAGNDEIIQ